MDLETEERWHAALEKRGKEEVRIELDLRPGRPEDLVFSIGDGPPYPTRAYCEAWYAGYRRKAIQISGTKAMVVITSLLTVVCIIWSISSASRQNEHWLSANVLPFSRQPVPVVRPTMPVSDDTLGNSAIQNSDVITTQDKNTLLPACSAVAPAGNSATVSSLPPCNKLGARALQQRVRPQLGVIDMHTGTGSAAGQGVGPSTASGAPASGVQPEDDTGGRTH
jgi:hypothetical protein